MSYRLPAPLRQDYSTQGQFNNKPATLPLPSPSNMPVSAWIGNKQDFQLSGTNPVSPFVASFVWSSPVYDLHPELRGLDGGGTSNNRNASSAVPIWGSAGKLLHVQLSRLSDPAANRQRYQIGVILDEFAHISDVGAVGSSQIAEKADISAQISNNTPSQILHFKPCGESGSYARFWRISLTIGQFEAQPGAFVPTYQVQGAFY